MSERARRLLAVAAVVASVAFYLHRNVILAVAVVRARPGDFAHYHAAARAILAGQSPFSVHNFDYPPLLAFLTVPLGLLPYLEARLVWFALSHALLALAAVLSWRLLGRSLTAAAAVAMVWAGAGTVAENLVLGQVHPLLLVLLVVSLGATSTRSPGQPRATAIALAAALKLWPGVLAVGALLDRDWRAFATTVALALLLIGGPLALVAVTLPPPHLPASRGYWMGTPAVLNYSLPATALRLASLDDAGGEPPTPWLVGNNPESLQLDGREAALSVATSVLGLALGLGLVAAAHRRAKLPPLALLAALVALALATAPISWYHYRILHFPGLAWLVWAALAERRPGRLAGLAALIAGLTWTRVATPVALAVPASYHALFITGRGLLVPLLELVLVALYLRQARAHAEPTAILAP